MTGVMVNPANVAAMMFNDREGSIKLELLMTGGQVIEVEGDDARDVFNQLEPRLLRVSGTP